MIGRFGTDPRQVVRVYSELGRVEGSPGRPVVMFWHGGSWAGGSIGSYGWLARALAGLGYVVVLAEYRLYPQVIFPDFVRDGAAAVAWVAANIEAYGGDPRRLALMGHSAGAHIAALLALDSHYLKEAGVSSDRVKALVGISGPYSFTPSPQNAPIFAGSRPQDWNPADHVGQDPPPALLLHGKLDKIVLPENSLALAAKLPGSELHLYRLLEHFAPLLLLAVPGGPVRRACRRFLAKTL